MEKKRNIKKIKKIKNPRKIIREVPLLVIVVPLVAHLVEVEVEVVKVNERL